MLCLWRGFWQRRIQRSGIPIRPFRTPMMMSSDSTQTKVNDPPAGVYADDSMAFAVDSASAAKNLLEYGPRGVYTTARTARHDRMFQFDKQVNRLVESAALMILDRACKEGRIVEERVPHKTHEKLDFVRANVSGCGELLDNKRVEERMKLTCKKAIELLNNTRPDWMEMDLRITLLYSWQPLLSEVDVGNYRNLPQPQEDSLRAQMTEHYGSSFEKNPSMLMCYVTRLPVRPRGPVKTVVRGAPRSNAAAKDSAWVHSRHSLEKKMAEDMEETLLIEFSSGRVMEGLQTNFMAIMNGVLYTASENVLNGTVRQLILEICDTHGIPYKLEGPMLDQAHLWEAAFITSTSRLILEIDEVMIPEDILAEINDECKELQHKAEHVQENKGKFLKLRYHPSECSLLSRLSAFVQHTVVEHSSPLE